MKIAQMTTININKRKGDVVTLVEGSNANVSLAAFDGTFDYSDFGATLCVGAAPEGPGVVDTYTATFCDEEGNVIETIEDIVSYLDILLHGSEED